MMDETRLDLRAADQDRMRQWEEAARESSRQVQEVMRMGVGMYPIVGRSGGRLYGTRRVPPVEVNDAPEDRDEEIKMNGDGTGLPEPQPSYQDALSNALYHARRATQEGRVRDGRQSGAMLAEASASQAWAAAAGLLRADETREGIGVYVEQLAAMNLTATGRKRDYIRTPSPEAQRLIAEAAQTELPKDGV